MRFHVLGLPHVATTKGKYLHCAYTQKVLNFCKMMRMLGHEVYHYGGEGSDPACTEHITTVTTSQRDMWFHANWERGDFPDMQFDSTQPYWMSANAAAIMAMCDRIQPRDFVCCITGTQAPVAQAFPENIAVEYGVGYEGIVLPFRCFESHAWRHHVYGLRGERDGNWYDAVIGNYYDRDDFPLGVGAGDYYVFLGRLISRKNPHIAAEICEKIGKTLIIAGQGVTEQSPGVVRSRELGIIGAHVKHIGVGVQSCWATL
jgi:glycosyltransferase involved in cell wall biosynthesis